MSNWFFVIIFFPSSSYPTALLKCDKEKYLSGWTWGNNRRKEKEKNSKEREEMTMKLKLVIMAYMYLYTHSTSNKKIKTIERHQAKRKEKYWPWKLLWLWCCARAIRDEKEVRSDFFSLFFCFSSRNFTHEMLIS